MAMDGAGERQVLTGRSAWIGLAGAFLFFSLRNWA